MTSPNPDTFRRALANFKAHLSLDEEEDFRLTSLKDLKLTIDKIQKKQASEKKMKNLRRLSLFLGGMEEFGKIIEVFLNSSNFVAYIWVWPSVMFFCDHIRVQPWLTLNTP
jgi:hypothetical protein